LLHRWTIEARIVENSTFPSVAALKGHSAWNFSLPGASGVANVDPEPSNEPGFLDSVRSLIEQRPSDASPKVELIELAEAARFAMGAESDAATPERAHFQQHLSQIELIAREFASPEHEISVVAYATVLLFAHMNRLQWFVAGRGESNPA
jgi:hypothetical protein